MKSFRINFRSQCFVESNNYCWQVQNNNTLLSLTKVNSPRHMLMDQSPNLVRVFIFCAFILFPK